MTYCCAHQFLLTPFVMCKYLWKWSSRTLQGWRGRYGNLVHGVRNFHDCVFRGRSEITDLYHRCVWLESPGEGEAKLGRGQNKLIFFLAMDLLLWEGLAALSLWRRCTCFVAWKGTQEGITTIARWVVWLTLLFEFTGSVGFKVSLVELQVDCWHHQVAETPTEDRHHQTMLLPLQCCLHMLTSGLQGSFQPVLSVFGVPAVLPESRLFTEVFMSPSFIQPNNPFLTHNSNTISVLNPQLRSFSHAPGVYLSLTTRHTHLDIP